MATVLARRECSSGDFKSTLELDSANPDARHNAEVLDRCIAKLVDSLRELQQCANGIAENITRSCFLPRRGMMLMASAGDLITLYLGLELMALSIYVLAGFMRNNNRSNEAAIKYLLLGAFSSGIMLYGMSLLYGLSGTTNLAGILAFLHATDLSNPVLFLAMIMLVVSFGFKVAAVPFHMWVPDVYEGAPTSVTAFMSAGPKVAGFAVLLRVFLYAFEPLHAHSTAILSGLAVLTMAVGNIMALSQTNIKRMLAYSSIAHAGYALVGLAAGGPDGAASVMLYVLHLCAHEHGRVRRGDHAEKSRGDGARKSPISPASARRTRPQRS